MTDYPGGETIALVQMVASGSVDALNQPVRTATVTAYVYGCVFQPNTGGPLEQQSDTVTSQERAWAFLPYVPGAGVPGTDATTGQPAFVAIDNSTWLQPQRPNNPQAQRNYKVLGLPEIEYDLDGMPSHAWVVCEWQGG